MKRLLVSLLIISVVGAAAVGFSRAFFSDTETSTGNTFTAGSLDLKINGQDNPTAIVDVGDLKPGDQITRDKLLRVIDNEALVWMHIKDLVATQGAQTEPEDLEESQNGIKFDVQNYLTYDLKLGDTDIITLADNILLPQATSCWIPLGVLPGNQEVTAQQSFHFDPAVTNWAQGDTLTFTEEFYAAQARNNPGATPPDTGTGRTWDPLQKKCRDCTTGKAWAGSLVSASQGTLKDGSPITDPNRTDPNKALGANDWVVGGSTNFFSLGKNGTLTLGFSTPVLDKAGADLSFHEATNGRDSYPEEKVNVEVSFDGTTWFAIGAAGSEPGGGGDGITYLDFASTGLPSVKYVRLTDTTNYGPHLPNADGYDLDAVDAINACIP